MLTGAATGSAAGGRRLVMLRHEQRQQKEDFRLTKGQEAATTVKDELINSMSAKLWALAVECQEGQEAECPPARTS